jgi:hypothetical protein
VTGDRLGPVEAIVVASFSTPARDQLANDICRPRSTLRPAANRPKANLSRRSLTNNSRDPMDKYIRPDVELKNRSGAATRRRDQPGGFRHGQGGSGAAVREPTTAGRLRDEGMRPGHEVVDTHYVDRFAIVKA